MEFTLVLTTYNDEKKIMQFLQDIMKQTILPAEIVLADGGSKDRTVELAEKFREESQVPMQIISGQRLNISQGFNVAIRAAKHEWIAIGAIGNHYEENFYEILIQEQQKTNADIVYPKIKGVEKTKFSLFYNQVRIGRNGMVGVNGLGHGSLIRKDLFYKYGFFYEKFYYAGEDTEFALRMRDNNCSFVYASDAILYWETPETIREHMKQVKGYSIAAMQIFENKYVVNYFIKVILLIMFLGLSILLLITNYLLCLSCIGVCCAVLLLIATPKFRGKDLRMIRLLTMNKIYSLVEDIYRVIVFVKFRRFLKKENKILQPYSKNVQLIRREELS